MYTNPFKVGDKIRRKPEYQNDSWWVNYCARHKLKPDQTFTAGGGRNALLLLGLTGSFSIHAFEAVASTLEEELAEAERRVAELLTKISELDRPKVGERYVPRTPCGVIEVIVLEVRESEPVFYAYKDKFGTWRTAASYVFTKSYKRATNENLEESSTN